jgi:hypothetical protein
MTIWDPKRLDEDRTPAPSRPAPRARLGFAARRVADGSGVCGSCQQPIPSGEMYVVFHAVLREWPCADQHWHGACWDRAYPEPYYFHLYEPR